MCSTRAALVGPVLAGCVISMAAVTGCGNSAETNVAGPSITRCGLSVTGGSSAAPAAGGTGTLTVSVARECAWSARSESPWISLSSTEGQGPGSLGYSIQPNPNGRLRRGGIVVEDQRVTISQDPAQCRFTVSPSTAALGASGGAIELTLVAPGGCAWTTRISDAWLSTEPSSGAGAATVRLALAPNPGPARTGTVTFGDTTLTVQQAGPSSAPPAPTPAPSPTPAPPVPPPPPPPNCSYRIEPVRNAIPAAGETLTVDVRAADGCGWSASSRDPWITVRSDSGTGNGSVRLTVAANTSPSARTGTAAIAGTIVTIEQAGAPPCTYALKPTSYNTGPGSDDVTIEVRSTGGCPWSATSSANWVSVSEGATGNGTGSVRLRVEANSGGPRTTTLTIAGEPLTLSQEGACRATLKPTDYNAKAGPDDVKVQVKVSESCSWSSSSPVTWATITEEAAQSGNANVRIRVDANPGAARSATLIIAGERFTLTQEASKK